MADIVYNSFKKLLLDGGIDLANDTIKVMLVTSSYVPDQDLHDFKDDISSEVAGAGYVSGGMALSGKTVSNEGASDEAVFDADDVQWFSSAITARGAVVYKDTGSASTSSLICYIDFGADFTSSGGTFEISWSSEGIMRLG